MGDGLCHFSQIHVCINLVCRSLSLVVAFAPLIVIARHHGCPMMRIGQWCAHGNAISCLYRYYLPAVMFRSICVISSSAFRVPSTNAAMCALSKAHGSDMSSEHRSDGRTIGQLALPYDSSPSATHHACGRSDGTMRQRPPGSHTGSRPRHAAMRAWSAAHCQRHRRPAGRRPCARCAT